MNKQRSTTTVYLDFKKAFDTLDHSILIQKLEKIGFSEKAAKLIKSYLKNRFQKTKANGTFSKNHIITCGVPQGSVLGPLLFLTYINDLGCTLKFLKYQHYADDTILFCSHDGYDRQIEAKIQTDLTAVTDWCKSNKLSLNVGKTKITVYGTKQFLSRNLKPNLHMVNSHQMGSPLVPYR